MATQTLFSTPYVEIELDIDRHIIRTSWTGFLGMKQAMEGMEHLLNEIQVHNIQHHISDQTGLKALMEDTKLYLQNDALKSMEEVGLKKLGIILAENISAKTVADIVYQKADLDQLEIRAFLDERDCLKWLVASYERYLTPF